MLSRVHILTLKLKSNDKDDKFIDGDTVRTSKSKIIFATDYFSPNWSEEFFVIKKVKNIVPWRYLKEDLNGEEIVEKFSEKKLQKENQTEFRIKKLIKKKGKGYDNSFKNWIDKKKRYICIK